MNISSEKTKTMAFKGMDAVGSKIVVNGNIIKQFNTFRYVENEILYQAEVDKSSKIANFLTVTGLIDRTLRSNKQLNETRLKVYHMLAVPVITYGCETLTMKKSDKSRIAVPEIKFMTRTVEVTL